MVKPLGYDKVDESWDPIDDGPYPNMYRNGLYHSFGWGFGFPPGAYAGVGAGYAADVSEYL